MKQNRLTIIIIVAIVLLFGIGGSLLLRNYQSSDRSSTTKKTNTERVSSDGEVQFTFDVRSEVNGYDIEIKDKERLMLIVRDDLQTYHVIKTPNIIVVLKSGDVSGENISMGRIFIDAPTTKVTTYIEITIDEKVIFDDKVTPVQKGIYFQEALFRILPYISKTTAVAYNQALIQEGYIFFNIKKVN